MDEVIAEDRLEAARIRDKLRESCLRNAKARQGKDKVKGPLVAKHNAALFSPISPRQARKRTPDTELLSPTKSSETRSLNQRRPSPQHSRHALHRNPRRSPSLNRPPQTSPSSQNFHQRRRTPSPGNLFDPPQIEVIQKRLIKVNKVRFFLLRQPGPNSFLIAADSADNKYKVIIGPQTCTCGKGPHCLHLLFVMVRVLQVKESDSYIWSRTLKNYEVEWLFKEYHKRRKSRVVRMSHEGKADAKKSSCQVDGSFGSPIDISPSPNMPSQEESLCPICLLQMTFDENLVTCHGCRNKLHHYCISIWAEECCRQNEPIICPLCRAHWRNEPELNRSFQCHSFKSPVESPQVAVSGPGPPTPNASDIMADHHLPLPRADPIPDCFRKSSKPWIEVFGADLVACFYSKDWAIRETAIRRLTREVVTYLVYDYERRNRSVRGHLMELKIMTIDKEIVLKCCSNILTLVANDPVYKVYTACLRCLRALLAYSCCTTNSDIAFLQSLVKPILETVILRCADGNKRTSQLSVATILELCRGQSGALAVGNLTRHPACGGLGGINFVLICALKKPSQQDVTWQWLLGRLCLISRLIEEFSKDFCLQYVSILKAHRKTAEDLSEPKSLNNERLHSILKFSLDSVNHTHATVSKMARRVFVQAARLCSSVPLAFTQVCEMLSSVDSSLQMHLKKKIVNSLKNITNDSSPIKCSAIYAKNSRSGSVSGDREKCLLNMTLNDIVSSKLKENANKAPKMQRSSSHSPGRAPNLSPLRKNVPTANHVPKICSRTPLKTVKRPNHLPLMTKTSSLLPNKRTVSPSGRIPKIGSPIFTRKHRLTENDSSLIDCRSRSPIIRRKRQECPTGDLIDLTPSSPDSGWSASFKSEIQSPNTPSVAPLFSANPASFLDEAGCEKKLDEAMMLSLVISDGLQRQSSLPQVPGLSKDGTVNDPAFVIHIQPEMEVNMTEDDKCKRTYQQHLHWDKGPLLGTGAFSTCFQARDIKSGTLMAVKQASYCRNSQEEQHKVMVAIKEEIMIMAKLDHPNVVRILGATQQGQHFNMFFEWMSGGSISGLLGKYGPFTESVIFNYTSQVLLGLSYLHDNHILHRDLKGANLLVDSTGRHLRIGDFGAAARLASQATVTGEFQGQLLGTIAFMAPEVLRGEDYGRSCDIWSVGCVIIEMSTSRPPWNAHDISNHLALMFKIARSTEPPQIPDHLSSDLRNLILECLTIKSDDRPTANQLAKSISFTNNT